MPHEGCTCRPHVAPVNARVCPLARPVSPNRKGISGTTTSTERHPQSAQLHGWRERRGADCLVASPCRALARHRCERDARLSPEHAAMPIACRTRVRTGEVTGASRGTRSASGHVLVIGRALRCRVPRAPCRVLALADDDDVHVGRAVGRTSERVGVARLSVPHLRIGGSENHAVRVRQVVVRRSQTLPEPSVTSASADPTWWTCRRSSALLLKTSERPGPKSVRPAMHCSGVSRVFSVAIRRRHPAAQNEQ
jgi:hypothetical protein